MKLLEAIEILTSTYQSIDAVALSLPVDAKEVADTTKAIHQMIDELKKKYAKK